MSICSLTNLREVKFYINTILYRRFSDLQFRELCS